MLTVIENNLHQFELSGRRMLFHIPSTALFELDTICGDVIDGLRREPACDHRDLVAKLPQHPAGDVGEVLDELIQIDLVADAGTRMKPVGPLKINQFPLTTVVLNVNTGCNLSCSYCYKEDLDKPTNARKMSSATARGAIEMLLAESPERPRYNVVFFGGEPLTNMALIGEVVAYAEQRFGELGKAVDFSLTTNATLLDEAVIDYLNEHRFSIAVSMDGPKAYHNRNRITVGGQGTYDVVARKARMLLQRYTARPVGVRVTLTRGVTDVEAIWQHLFGELGFAEVGFAPVTSGDLTGYNLDGDELAAVFAGMKRLGERYLEAALEGRNIGFANLHQLLTDLWQGNCKSLPCGAGVGMVAVDHEGSVNLCHRFTGSDLPTFGHVDKGLAYERLSGFLSERADRTGTGCETCYIRNLCSGGCYHESYARYSDPVHPTYHYCELMRDWVDFGIRVFSEIAEHNPAFFDDSLGPRRGIS